jgi:hypothetical protein
MSEESPVSAEIAPTEVKPHRKAGRQIGSTGRGYKQSPATYHQRCIAPLRTGEYSSVMNNIIKKQGLTEEETKVLSEERQNIWKKMQTPAIMLMDEYVDLKTLISMKRVQGNDILGKEVLKATELLLSISKEINRLTTVSADKKMEVFAKSWNGEEDLTIDIDMEPKNE